METVFLFVSATAKVETKTKVEAIKKASLDLKVVPEFPLRNKKQVKQPTKRSVRVPGAERDKLFVFLIGFHIRHHELPFTTTRQHLITRQRS